MDPDERADDGGARLRAGLQAALKEAIRSRDTVAVSALRTTLGAIANAEAAGTRAQAAAASGLSAQAERLHTEATVLTSVIAALDLGHSKINDC